MNVLTKWRARRAGGRITVYHATGKVVGVDSIEVQGGNVVATDKSGVKYRLALGNE